MTQKSGNLTHGSMAVTLGLSRQPHPGAATATLLNQSSSSSTFTERICVFGLNHTTAPIELREQFALSEDSRLRLLARLRSCAAIEEAAVLSTCNRVEFIITLNPAVVPERSGEAKVYNLPLGGESKAPHHLIGIEHSISFFLEEVSGLKRDQFRPFIYILSGGEAILHLLTVASGLDSMVPGETEILGQMKSAYAEAHNAGATGGVLNPLFQNLFRAAKHVRTSGTIGREVSSVVSLTRRIARREFCDLPQRRLLIVGAGDTAELALKLFADAGLKSITVLNRTVEHAQKIAARCGANCGGIERLLDAVHDADIVITAAALPAHAAPLISAELAPRAERPLLLLDLGVPRNISESLRGRPGVALYNIDDLESEVKESAAICALERKRAESLIRSESAEISQRLEDAFAAALRRRTDGGCAA